MSGSEDIENGNEGDDRLTHITLQLQEIQRSLTELEDVYPDLHDYIETLKQRVGDHESVLHEHDERATEYHAKGAIHEETARIVAEAMEFTLNLIVRGVEEMDMMMDAKSRLDVIITELTKARSELLASIPRDISH